MIKEYRIERIDALDDIAYLKDELIKFWRHKQNGTRPALKLPVI